FHQHFKTYSGGTRSYEFSKYLINKGHKVTMVTGNNIENNNINGIHVKSTNTKYKQHFSFIRRILSFVHFMIKSTFIGLKEKNPDIIVATSTPLTIGFPALVVSKLKRKKFVFEVRDVWPDVPIELGFINGTVLKKILFFLEKLIYRNASHIIVLSDGMKNNLLKKGIPREKLTVITNLSMNKHYDNIDSNKRVEYKDKLLCIHPGTMGVVNGLEYILDVAEEYPDEEIVYLLIGEGNQKHKLIDRINKNKIKNVIIEDAIPKSDVIKKIKESDVGVMTVANYSILHDNSANKFFDYLAAGLPVVINYGGWQKAILEANNAGKGFNYDDKEGFYNFLKKLKTNRDLLSEYGKNAKKLALNKYDSQILAKEFENVIKKVI